MNGDYGDGEDRYDEDEYLERYKPSHKEEAVMIMPRHFEEAIQRAKRRVSDRVFACYSEMFYLNYNANKLEENLEIEGFSSFDALMATIKIIRQELSVASLRLGESRQKRAGELDALYHIKPTLTVDCLTPCYLKQYGLF